MQSQAPANGPILQQVLTNQGGESVVVVTSNRPAQQLSNQVPVQTVAGASQSHTTPSSLIKSLLANKVTTSDALSAASTHTTNVASSIITTTSVNVPQQVTPNIFDLTKITKQPIIFHCHCSFATYEYIG